MLGNDLTPARQKAALAHAEAFGFLRKGDEAAQKFAESKRFTTAREYADMTGRAGELIDQGLEPYVLYPDPMNPGYEASIEVFDVLANVNDLPAAKTLLSLNTKEALVDDDTLIRWR